MIQKAVILSAGFGTRLKPLTDTMPKVMIPFFGKPLLEHHILHLKKHGINEFFINLHYLPNVVIDYFGDGHKWDIKITYTIETPDILGTAGGIKNFESNLNDPFFVIYGDVFSLVDYTKMAKAWHSHPSAIATEIIGTNDHPHDSDLVILNSDLRFQKILIKPNPTLPPAFKTMRALFIMHPRILKHIPAHAYYEIDHQLLPKLVDDGEAIFGYDCGNDFLKDVGTMKRYQTVTQYLEEINYRPF